MPFQFVAQGPMALPAAGGTGPVAFDAKSTSETYLATAPGTITHNNLTVGSGTNRALVCILVIGDVVVPTGLAVTWNGAALAFIGSSLNVTNGRLVGLFGMINPDSGNRALIATWSGASLDTYIAGISFTGVDQTSAAVAFPSAHVVGAIDTTATVNPSTITVPSAVANMVVGCYCTGSSFDSVSGTQIFINNGGSAVSGAANYDAGASSVILNGVQHTANTWAALGCDVKSA